MKILYFLRDEIRFEAGFFSLSPFFRIHADKKNMNQLKSCCKQCKFTFRYFFVHSHLWKNAQN